MLTVNKLLPRSRGIAPVLLKRAATVELDWDVRQKSRFDVTDSQGRALGIFLPRGSVVRGGDVLVAEDGSLLRVLAASQPVLVVRHCSDHGSPFDLLRAAYHLGNRHVPLELQPDHLKLEPDHVLADMLRQMHLIVSSEQAAFEPENGAYAAGGSAHGHEDHAHQGHEHASHGHEQRSREAHAGHEDGGHGHGHLHDRDHDHGHDNARGHEGHDHAQHGHAKHDHGHDEHGHGPNDHDHDHGHGNSAHGHDDHDHAEHDHAKHDHGHGHGHGR